MNALLLRLPWSLEQLVTLSSCVMLVSCSTTHSLAPASSEELAHLVLIIRETPDGKVTHSWQRAEEFAISDSNPHTGIRGTSGRLVRVSNQQRDCHAEYLECHRDCKDADLPRGYDHIPRGSARHDSFCWEKCKQPYLDCEKLQELLPQEFTATDDAIDWLKRNHQGVLVGSLIIIAGVTFVVVSAGAGLLVLAPVVLVASAPMSAEPSINPGTP